MLICAILLGVLWGETYSFTKEEYLTMDLGKRIDSVKVSNRDILYVEYDKTGRKPFTKLTVYGKDYGKAYIYVTYADGTHEKIKVHVQHDMAKVKSVLKQENGSLS
ncbi:MAG TPA: hypothetical protein ENK93_05495, partial [Campylobacteraceae bacterium]|nr:hypothetical protein [Campylobacteraceae bacterium]